jgi:flagellar hook-associated protein 1
MAGLNVALEVGKRALFSQQTAVNVTGHNIANVNTPGFSRQRAALVPGNSIDSPTGRLGTGVQVAMVERIYDRYLAAQISAQVQGKGKAETEKLILEQVESIFNETSGQGLHQALNDFWNAWSTLSINPTGAAERSGLGLVDEFPALAYVFLHDQGMEGNADGCTLAPHRRRLGRD